MCRVAVYDGFLSPSSLQSASACIGRGAFFDLPQLIARQPETLAALRTTNGSSFAQVMAAAAALLLSIIPWVVPTTTAQVLLVDEVPTHVCNNVAVTDKTGLVDEVWRLWTV